jgi:oligosaccharide repeat unit polymerase
MTFLLLGVLAVAVATGLRRGGDLLSPSRIYIGVYSLLLSVYFLNLSQLQTPWAFSTHLLFWGSSFTFVAGGFWAWILAKSRHPEWQLDFVRLRASLAEDRAALDWRHFGKVLWFCIWGYLASFVISLVITGGLPAFMENPDRARMDFFSASLLTNYGIFLGPTSLMLGLEMLWFSDLSKQARRRVAAMLILVLLTYITIVTRYDLFRVLIFSIALYHYGKRPLRLPHLALGMSLAIGMFLVGFLARVSSDTIGTFNEMIKIKLPHRIAWASNIYAYLANDFWNLDFAMKRFVEAGDREYPMQWGASLFRPLLSNLHLEHPIVMSYGFDTMFNESATKVEGLNTVVYVWHLYKDFGFAGAFILTFVAGLCLWKFYLNTLMAPRLFGIAVLGILAGAVALSYHSPLWEMWFVYLNLGMIAIAHRKLRAF